MCGYGRRHKICISYEFLAEADVAGPHTLSASGPKLNVRTHRPQYLLRKTLLHNNYI